MLILPTNPSAARWEATTGLAEACRSAARDRNAGLADTEHAIHAAGKEDRGKLFVHDWVHLSRVVHGVGVEAVLEAIEASGR